MRHFADFSEEPIFICDTPPREYRTEFGKSLFLRNYQLRAGEMIYGSRCGQRYPRAVNLTITQKQQLQNQQYQLLRIMLSTRIQKQNKKELGPLLRKGKKLLTRMVQQKL